MRYTHERNGTTMPISNDMTLANRIAYLQERSGLSQIEIAQKLGIDPSAFSKIKTGTRKVSADELNKLADVFKVTTDYLLGRKVDDDLLVAAHMDDDLTPEQKKEIEEYIEFKKAQYRKEHEKD